MAHPGDYRHAIPPGLTATERLAWWRRIVREIKECSLAQRRATIARAKMQPAPTPLTKMEELWLQRSQSPQNFPPQHTFPGSTLCDI